MDLEIGAHCSLPSCNVLDFLPITCSCSKTFCSNHISPELHHCPLLNQTSPNPSTSDNPLPRCCFKECHKLALESRTTDGNHTCTACRQNFCVDHRFPDVHNCVSTKPNPTSVPTSGFSARQPPTVRMASKKPPTDPAKLAQWQKMELMKMRHRASPGDMKDKSSSLPPGERLHIKIVSDNKEHVFWFRKDVATGRVLDLLVSRLQLYFPKDQALKLQKLQYMGEPVSLFNDRLLSDQVEDGSLLGISVALD
ncbi:hypothetical protein CPC08DRAFT_706851 [Agrocybe pediades]|nr:hypothetical protein CPC08DRAFT_706851 [Agrocybe pediades]